MARPTMDDIRSLGDFAVVYQWNLNFSTFPSAVSSSPQSGDLNWRCTTATVPKRASTATEVVIRGHKVKQPGVYTYDNQITLSFVETADNMITAFLVSWLDSCWQSKTGVQATKDETTCDIELELLDRQGEQRATYKIYGCFLESYDPGGDLADCSGSDAVKPTATISYDYFEIEGI